MSNFINDHQHSNDDNSDDIVGDDIMSTREYIEFIKTEFKLESNISNLLQRSEYQSEILPSLSISAIVDSHIVYSHCQGQLTDENTVYLLASISKTFLAIIVLQCIERNEIDIDQDINYYLCNSHYHNPMIDLDDKSIKNPHFPDSIITIRQLLQHRSSLHDNETALCEGSQWRIDGNQDYPGNLADYVYQRLCPPSNRHTTDAEKNADTLRGRHYDPYIWHTRQRPGEARYHYSNAGFTLLGFIVEVVTGKSLSSLAHQYIFDPLDMKDTEYFLSLFEEKSIKGEFDMNRIVKPHREGNQRIAISTEHYSVAEWPACQIRSSLKDLTKYLTTLISCASSSSTEDTNYYPLLSKESIDLMLPSTMTNGLAWWGKDTSYGDAAGRHWSHGGFMEGVRTHIYIWPGSNDPLALETQRLWKGAIILTNSEIDYKYITRAIEAGLYV